jgi:hypothetical protein
MMTNKLAANKSNNSKITMKNDESSETASRSTISSVIVIISQMLLDHIFYELSENSLFSVSIELNLEADKQRVKKKHKITIVIFLLL